MKQYNTKFIKLVSLFFVFFPINYIFIVATLFNIDFHHCIDILFRPSYYLISLLIAIAGYGFWEMKRWAWYVYLTSQLFILFENAALIHSYSDSHYKIVVYFLSLFCQLAFTYRIAKDIRVPYFFPKIRWWESNPRYRLSIPAHLKRKNLESCAGDILDLAVAGCFIKTRKDFDQDEFVQIKFEMFGIEFESEGVIVWRAQSTVTHPQGVGVKFLMVSKLQRRALRVLTRKLKKIAGFYQRSSDRVNQTEVLKFLDEMDSSNNTKADKRKSS